jgi:tRNA(Ile)-lysidine synthase
MLNQTSQYLQSLPEWETKKYLLAVSGGVDSMVLTELFSDLKLNFEIAHCNFKLRNQESDNDQQFIEEFARQSGIKLHLKICDLSDYKNNIQIAAREQRYQWFEELKNQFQFDYIVTAHHLNDSIETFFINLLRSTGLKGLLGIQDHKNIIRPLQKFTRDEILAYAREKNIAWREDSSNQSDKYLRNFIRHQIIPKMEERTTDFYQNFRKTLTFLQQNQLVTEQWFSQMQLQFIHHNNNFYIEIDDLKQINPIELFLYNWLSPYGFTDWEAIQKLISAQSGKEVFSTNYRLTRHKNRLILQAKQPVNQKIYTIQYNQKHITDPFLLQIFHYDKTKIEKNVYLQANSNEVYIDEALVLFPLIIRKWKKGDYFYPLGMKGKKKLSDFFKDEQMTPAEKENTWLICNQNNDIIWVTNKRLDNRYKITEKTKNIIHIKLV